MSIHDYQDRVAALQKRVRERVCVNLRSVEEARQRAALHAIDQLDLSILTGQIVSVSPNTTVYDVLGIMFQSAFMGAFAPRTPLEGQAVQDVLQAFREARDEDESFAPPTKLDSLWGEGDMPKL